MTIFSAWLNSLGRSAPVPSLTALRQFNRDHRATAIPYGQTLLDISDERDLSADAERYRRDRAKDLRLARSQGIDAVLRRHQLDALLFPGWSSEAVVNRAGYPAVVVPIALMVERPRPPLPPGVRPSRRSFGLAFVGTACSETTLLGMAAAYERVAGGRVAPSLP